MILGQPRQMPLNTFQGWKYILIAVVIFLGAFLALPNMFGEDYAIQISNKKGLEISQSLLDNIAKEIEKEGVSLKESSIDNGRGLIRLNSSDDQLVAKKAAFQYVDSHSEEVVKDETVVALNLAPATPKWLADLGVKPMKLGLDLRGGISFLLQVDMEGLYSNELETAISTIKSLLYEEKVYHEGVYAKDSSSVSAKFKTEELRDKAFAALVNKVQGFEITDKEVDGVYILNFKITLQKIKDIQSFAIKQNITTLRNRVNAIGVAEPMIQQQGANRIIVQLPGIQDTTRARTIIGDTRTLQFRLVNDRRDVQSAISGRVPGDSEVIYEVDGRPHLVLKSVMLDGERISSAGTGIDERGLPQINIQLDGAGGSKMATTTRDKIGQQMAIILTDTNIKYKMDENGDLVKDKKGDLIVVGKKIEKSVASAATIQSQLGQSFRITGQFSQQEASDLALILKSGSLKAPISIVSESTIGASLGKENVKQGLYSIGLGFVLVLFFMIVRYKVFGLVANVALFCNLILIVGMMSMIGAVLTLPGMAGIVLTVGMAVDANVLIFERIREELKEGASPAQAIHNGYDRAFSTIADANITTMIAALILFAIGTGPVAGFAITLLFGIITSMFTAIVGSRALINLIYGGKAVKKISV